MNTASNITALSGIRGVAILLVLLSHSSNNGLYLHPLLSFSGAGRYGVFLFFVLSAFLLTRQFIEREPAPADLARSLPRYFRRRFLRIYPLFCAALLAYLAFTLAGHPIYLLNAAVVAKSLLLLDAEGIFWTIPVEFQYYFVLPLVALLLISVRDRVLLAAGGTALFTLLWWHAFPPRYTTNLLPFAPIFVMGSFAAWLHRWLTRNHAPLLEGARVKRTVNILAGGSLLTFVVLTPNFYNLLFSADVGRTRFHEEFLAITLMSASFVLLTTLGDGLIRRLMESRFFIFWGNISFSAYLLHMIFITGVKRLPLANPLRFLVFIGLTAGLSFVSYRWFELPLSKIGARNE
jgi:peptidoglycan/LPS O-acetylase OafA/YrhL